METGAELENEVVVGARPSLFQFAKLLGDYETAVPAVVDTNTARFFVTNYGKLKETDAPTIRIHTFITKQPAAAGIK